MRYGYARVSTREQDETRQVEAIKRKGVEEENIIIEKALVKQVDVVTATIKCKGCAYVHED